jgi:hypothetical protein
VILTALDVFFGPAGLGEEKIQSGDLHRTGMLLPPDVKDAGQVRAARVARSSG